MKTLSTDENNNLLFRSDFLMVDDIESIKQDTKHRLLMWQTEYPFDIEEGMPWYNLANSPDKNAIKIAVKKRILGDDRIKSIIALNLDFASGQLNISASLDTTAGVVNV